MAQIFKPNKTKNRIINVTKMVRTAQQNAQQNSIDNLNFVVTNLNDTGKLRKEPFKSYNKVLLDPAREGAMVAID